MALPENEYPEHFKLGKVQKASQRCGQWLDAFKGKPPAIIKAMYEILSQKNDPRDPLLQFLPWWLKNRKRVIVRYDTIQGILARYFEIDLRALENEKRKMLEIIQEGK